MELAELEAKKTKAAVAEGKIPPSSQFKLERSAYLFIIAILVGYILFDLAFLHAGSLSILDGDKDPVLTGVDGNETNTTITKEPSNNDQNQGTKNATEPPKEEPKGDSNPPGSGNVALSITTVDYEKVSNSVGYITSVSFSIKNSKDTPITPVVNVYAYDSELEESWETRSRGNFKYPAGIAPGKSIEGSIELSPKTFRSLNLAKTVRIELNDTKSGFLKLATQTVEIE